MGLLHVHVCVVAYIRSNAVYSAYISRVFIFANLEPFAKLIQRKFCHMNHFSLELHVHDVKMALFQYFNKVDGNYPGTNLPDPRGALSKEVPSSSISATSL